MTYSISRRRRHIVPIFALLVVLCAYTYFHHDSSPISHPVDYRSTKRSPSSSHYDSRYFAWQHDLNVLKSKLDVEDDGTFKGFGPFNRIVEFGASSGAVLHQIAAQEKIGIEINPVARYHAVKEYGLKMVEFADEVPTDWADFAYTSSVLEHVECPVCELRSLNRILRPGGMIYVSIRNEGVNKEQVWKPDDINKHLYTWNELILGNCIEAAGFEVMNITSAFTAWPKNIQNLVDQGLERHRLRQIIEDEGRRRNFLYIYGVGRKQTRTRA